MATSADLLARTGDALSRIGERTPAADETAPSRAPAKRDQLAELFDQPYIDPLTRYLAKHADDPAYSGQLERVRRERDRRCRAIAENFAAKPRTEETLTSYRAGYSFSCPGQVAAYERALAGEQERQASAEKAKKAEQAENPEESAQAAAPIQDDQLSECYLLTTIRNFTEARRVCQEPAEAGDVRAQANMALISHALADYRQAHQWARKAAAESSEAAYLLGRMYTNGQGVEADPARAEKWYHQAAGQGHAGAKAVLRERSDSSGITKTQ
ncbi:MAG: SEL1-like repeat protein [Marinobacter sp.]|uniref:tetratricopeptide repeat protein n=1 Tax=Marinobacter sp. TaxID=50741 RepID=UPI00299E6F6B|nr:SEL1-like repeat protein [Marinobacter sp.]MDX1635944.1 SEL1-like repeat protein [Marinobacter sp.]